MEHELMYEETKIYYKVRKEGRVYIFISCQRYNKNKGGVEESFDVECEDGGIPSPEIIKEIIEYGINVIG